MVWKTPSYGQAIQPNLLINGGYDIWQRGIGTLPYGNTGNTYLADKWLRIDGITAIQVIFLTSSLLVFKFFLGIENNILHFRLLGTALGFLVFGVV